VSWGANGPSGQVCCFASKMKKRKEFVCFMFLNFFLWFCGTPLYRENNTILFQMRFWNSDTSFFLFGGGRAKFLSLGNKKQIQCKKKKTVRSKFLKSPYFRKWVTAG
jgi:hypothetical protein